MRIQILQLGHVSIRPRKHAVRFYPLCMITPMHVHECRGVIQVLVLHKWSYLFVAKMAVKSDVLFPDCTNEIG